MGRRAGDGHVARRGTGLIIRGVFSAIAFSGVVGAAQWILDPPARAPSPAAEPAESGGNGFADLLLWGGLALAGLAAAVLAGWAGWRARRRHTVKRRRQQALERSHDAVAAAYGAYLADVLEWLERPALSDVSVPETAVLVQALAAADDARLGNDVEAYQRAVAVLRTAWQAADDHARRTGLRQLPRVERRAAEQARKLLAMALNSSCGEHERRSAYAKARDLLDGILVVPPQAVATMEDKHRLALIPKPFRSQDR
ncbi:MULTISPECIES: DUF2786 domain-containing protein [unclassified Streptomyces]|uniref:DUF2786 domain-containing protein n=1 Tax=unclassified Streptomyces TaxID=2593676 RepID=UPI001EF07584|nr:MULTISPECIES: hypothetical protein [unclassified Streptomyces]